VPLTVLHCYWDALGIARTTLQVADDDHTVDDLRRLVAEATAGMAERYPDVEVRLELARGAPEQLLVLAAETHDLVVVGHHHAGALSTSLRGSSAVTVVELSSAPVLVVPLAAPARSRADAVRTAGR
jgi:nucleotide-binding universal stress UspA family protein